MLMNAKMAISHRYNHDFVRHYLLYFRNRALIYHMASIRFHVSGGYEAEAIRPNIKDKYSAVGASATPLKCEVRRLKSNRQARNMSTIGR